MFEAAMEDNGIIRTCFFVPGIASRGNIEAYFSALVLRFFLLGATPVMAAATAAGTGTNVAPRGRNFPLESLSGNVLFRRTIFSFSFFNLEKGEIFFQTDSKNALATESGD